MSYSELKENELKSLLNAAENKEKNNKFKINKGQLAVKIMASATP